MRLSRGLCLQVFAFWLAAGTAGAQMPNTDLYGVLLDRYTREVRDLAGTRVDYVGLRHSREWRTMMRQLEGFELSRLQTREHLSRSNTGNFPPLFAFLNRRPD